MSDLTDAEYDTLDELWTNNPPKVSGNGKNGFFIKHRNEIVILDPFSAAWLKLKSEATHKTPAELISEMVREKASVIQVTRGNKLFFRLSDRG